jgi:hypothetical protein
MDKEYIEMCRSAEEIQEQWEPKEGDITIDKNGLETICPNFGGFDKGYWKKHTEWIMRQEDLQAIALNHESMKGFSSWWIMVHFMDFYEKSSLSVKLDLTSVWLAFVMETCYGKRWNSEKKCWVKV